MFKNFYRTTFSLLKPLLLLLGLLLPFSLCIAVCIADGYISISDDWDEIVRNHKTYYFENGLDHFNQGQYSKPLKILKRRKNTALGLAAFI
ncbi:hypothetical protein BTM435_09890 [Helicobacter pylori]